MRNQKQNQSQEVKVVSSEEHGFVIEVVCTFLGEEILENMKGALSGMFNELGGYPPNAKVLKTIYNGKAIKVDCHLYDSKENHCLCTKNSYDDNRCYLLE